MAKEVFITVSIVGGCMNLDYYKVYKEGQSYYIKLEDSYKPLEVLRGIGSGVPVFEKENCAVKMVTELNEDENINMTIVKATYVMVKEIIDNLTGDLSEEEEKSKEIYQSTLDNMKRVMNI